MGNMAKIEVKARKYDKNKGQVLHMSKIEVKYGKNKGQVPALLSLYH